MRTGSDRSQFRCLVSAFIVSILPFSAFAVPDADGYYHVPDEYATIADALTQCNSDAVPGAPAGYDEGKYLILNPGWYSITTGLTSNGCGIVGAVVQSGTAIVWDGAAGGTMLTMSGDTSHSRLEHLQFRSGTARPDYGVVFSDQVDSYVDMNNLSFKGHEKAGIYFSNGWVNVEVENLRCDNYNGWCVQMKPKSGQNGTVATFKTGSIDNNVEVSTEGAFLIENDVANALAPGEISISDWRVEWNTDLIGDKAFFSVRKPLSGTVYPRGIELSLFNIFIDDVANTVGDSVVHRSSLNVGGERLNFNHVWAPTTDFLVAPTNMWTVYYDVSNPVGAIQQLTHGAGDPYPSLTVMQNEMKWLGSSFDDAFITRNPANTYNRWKMLGSGKMSWGIGTSDLDTTLERDAAASLKVTGKLAATAGLAPGSGTLSQLPASPGPGMMFFVTDSSDCQTQAIGFEAQCVYVQSTGWRALAVQETPNGVNPGIGTVADLPSAATNGTIFIVTDYERGGAQGVNPVGGGNKTRLMVKTADGWTHIPQ